MAAGVASTRAATKAVARSRSHKIKGFVASGTCRSQLRLFIFDCHGPGLGEPRRVDSNLVARHQSSPESLLAWQALKARSICFATFSQT